MSTLLLLFFGLIVSRSPFARAAAGVLEAVQSDSAPRSFTVIPIEYTGGHIFLHLSDPSLGYLRLLLDSGFEKTTIDLSSEKSGKVSTSIWDKFSSGNGLGNGPAARKLGELPLDLRVDGNSVFRATTPVMDFHNWNQASEEKVDGALGWDFFARWCVRLDFPDRQMALSQPSDCQPPSRKHGTLHGQWLPEGFLIPALITFENGRTAPTLLHLDTGSNGTLILNQRFRRLSGVRSTDGRDALGGGTGIDGKFTADVVTLTAIDFDRGSLVLNGGPISALIVRSGSFRTLHGWNAGTNEAKMNRDGLVGTAVLERLILTFDPARKCIYIETPSSGTSR